MDFLPRTVLTAENVNHQRTQEQRKCRTQKQHAKNVYQKVSFDPASTIGPQQRPTGDGQGKILGKNKM